jgi:ABC-type Na+ transport system ATPase subunit NatA
MRAVLFERKYEEVRAMDKMRNPVSALLRLLASVLEPTTGNALVDGLDVRSCG